MAELEQQRRTGEVSPGLAADSYATPAGATTPPPRFVIHVGRQKSGTSALQHSLFSSRGLLAERGVLYPKPASGVAHHDLAHAFRRGEFESGVGATEFAPPGRYHTVILSSEQFQNVDPTVVREWLGRDTELTVVGYVREQYRYAQSAYAQKVHAQLCTEMFAEYCSTFRPDYVSFAESWAAVADSFFLGEYQRSRLVDGDIVADFCAMIELDVKLAEGSASHNPSIGGDVLRLKRELNSCFDDAQALRGASYKVLGQLAEEHATYRLRPALPPDEVEAFRAQFRQQNAELHSAFGVEISPGSGSVADGSELDSVTWREPRSILYERLRDHGAGALVDSVERSRRQ